MASISIPSLLSFNGRLRRSHYWVTSIALGVVKAVLTVILTAVAGQAMTGDGWVGSLVEALFLWPTLALLVKRGHDRDRPARFGLVLVIIVIAAALGAGAAEAFGRQPLMIACFVVLAASFGFLLVDYGFIDGTPGPNRFGPSPKGIGAGALDVAETFD